MWFVHNTNIFRISNPFQIKKLTNYERFHKIILMYTWVWHYRPRRKKHLHLQKVLYSYLNTCGVLWMHHSKWYYAFNTLLSITVDYREKGPHYVCPCEYRGSKRHWGHNMCGHVNNEGVEKNKDICVLI